MIHKNLHLQNLWFSKFTPLEYEIYPRGKFTPGLEPLI